MKLPFDIFQEQDLFSDQNFENKLHDFLAKERKPFSLNDVLLKLGKKDSPAHLSQLSEYLVVNNIAYCHRFSDTEELWLSRAGLFTGKEFAVVPSKTELATGIFIPGSRCVPFANPKLLPHQFQFFADGTKLPQTLVDTTEDEIYPYYSLFGEEFTPQYLAMDNPENQEIFHDQDFFLNEKNEFPVTVVDMSKFYWENEVRPGDTLIFKVKNWDKAIFSVSVRHKKDEDKEELKNWRRQFEGMLMLSFQAAGPAASIDEQLTVAFFIGGEELFEFPPDDISLAISSSETIELVPYGAETRLWQKGKPFPAPETWEEWLAGTTGVDPEDEIFASGGRFPINDSLLDAYVMDALYKKETSPEKLIKRITKLCPPSCKVTLARDMEHAVVITQFYTYLKTYNWFADREAGAIRERLLELYSKIIAFIFEIQRRGILPRSLSDQDVIMLGQLTAHIVTCAESFYNDPQSLATLIPEESLDGMEETFEDLKISIQNTIGDLRRKR